MRLPSPEVIASWPTPNYVNPITHGPATIILTGIFFPLILIILGIRVYTRICISKSFGLDDWLILATIPFTAVFAALIVVTEVDLEWNRHIWDVHIKSIEEVERGLKLLLVAQYMFAISTTLTKLSMLSLTYRILASASSRLRPWIVVAFVVIALDGVVFCIGLTIQCAPDISKYWKLSVTDQHCIINEPKNILAAGIVNVITDLVVVLLPIPTVLHVKIPLRETIIVVCLFSAGLIGTGVGAARVYYTHRVNQSDDKTWDIFASNVTALSELYIGIICASLPATKKFFSRYMPILLRSASHPSHHLTSNTRLSANPVLTPAYHGHKLTSSINSVHTPGLRPSLGIRVETVLEQETAKVPLTPTGTLEKMQTASSECGREMSISSGPQGGAKDSKENLVLEPGRSRASSGTLGFMGGVYRQQPR